jgi:hypothetical protein
MVIVIIGNDLPADLAGAQAAGNALNAKVAANRAELDALAIQARDLARGTVPMPSTVAARDALLKKLCEAFARMWFNERFGDE